MGSQGDLRACRELRSPGSTPGSLRAGAVSFEIRQQPPRFVCGANVTSIRFRWGLVTHDSALHDTCFGKHVFGNSGNPEGFRPLFWGVVVIAAIALALLSRVRRLVGLNL